MPTPVVILWGICFAVVGGALFHEGVSFREAVIGSMFLTIGPFISLGGATNWDWWWQHEKTQRVVATLGKGGTRVFHILLGIAMFSLGVWFSLDPLTALFRRVSG